MDLLLLFDTEDIFSPPDVGNDDSIKDLATILTEEGLRGTFLFIGDRALHLRERGRSDVIAALEPHDVGLHTRSGRHPTGPEYVQNKSWDEGLAESLRQEREGAEIIREIFGKPARALSSHYSYATPHAHRAAAILGLPYVYAFPAAPPLYGPSWYCSALGFPWSSPTLDGAPFLPYRDGFDSHYSDNAAFEAKLNELDQQIDTCVAAGHRVFSFLAYHPQRVRLAEFIDRFWSPNGINYLPSEWGTRGTPRRYTAEQVQTALANFRRLARWIRHDARLNPITVSEATRRHGQQPSEIDAETLFDAARAIADSREILLHDRFSQAEILVGLARSIVTRAETGKLPDVVARDDVLGPTRNPVWFPEVTADSWETHVARSRELLDHVQRSGHLPANFGEIGERVGINNLYHALGESYVALRAGRVPTALELQPMPRYPRLAEAIGHRFVQATEGGLFDPDVNVDAVYRHGKLQTWTLKPAMLATSEG